MRSTRRLALTAFIFSGLVAAGAAATPLPQAAPAAVEAPAGFDGRTNGFVDQETFEAARAVFGKVETPEEGLGPVYNAASCAECHANPVAGGGSQVLVVRAGHFANGAFVAPPGGTLIQSRALFPQLQERIPDGFEVRAFRLSPSTLGLGYVEAIDDATLLAIADSQRRETDGRVAGQAISVSVVEAPGATRVGRFGWKCQHASLVSFAGDAYVNEMGVTTSLFPDENTSNGRPVDQFRPHPGLDDEELDDVESFATFMRATKAPDRDQRLAGSPDAVAGEQLFRSTGCAVCHVASIQTAPAGTLLPGGFEVPEALGGKTIHPYSDFLLHDVGTGDGIVDNGLPETRNKLRTAPLWGLRTRNRYMHDGLSLTVSEAIARHAGEARAAADRYNALNRRQRRALVTFLDSL